jgi:hypothetical protein
MFLSGVSLLSCSPTMAACAELVEDRLHISSYGPGEWFTFGWRYLGPVFGVAGGLWGGFFRFLGCELWASGDDVPLLMAVVAFNIGADVGGWCDVPMGGRECMGQGGKLGLQAGDFGGPCLNARLELDWKASFGCLARVLERRPALVPHESVKLLSESNDDGWPAVLRGVFVKGILHLDDIKVERGVSCRVIATGEEHGKVVGYVLGPESFEFDACVMELGPEILCVARRLGSQSHCLDFVDEILTGGCGDYLEQLFRMMK